MQQVPIKTSFPLLHVARPLPCTNCDKSRDYCMMQKCRCRPRDETSLRDMLHSKWKRLVTYSAITINSKAASFSMLPNTQVYHTLHRKNAESGLSVVPTKPLHVAGKWKK